MGASQKLPFMLGDWRIDPQADVISRADSNIKLVPKTMEVLGYLVQRAGEVVSRRTSRRRSGAMWL
jgi:DNA-binding winged helix-turn-helix (wHTH) protein